MKSDSEYLKDILSELKLLNQNIKTLSRSINPKAAANSTQQELSLASTSKNQGFELSDEEIKNYKSEFAELFDLWINGNEIAAHNRLQGQQVEKLRAFADANNLNVTAKMPKEKILKLIDMRFREKKLLTSSFNQAKPDGNL